MALPDLVRKEAEEVLGEYCSTKIPPHLRDQIRLSYEFRGDAVTLYESREVFLVPGKWTRMSIAQFRYDSRSMRWTLYCADRNDRWHDYLETGPSRRLKRLLKEVESDPTGIFWG